MERDLFTRILVKDVMVAYIDKGCDFLMMTMSSLFIGEDVITSMLS